MPRSRMGGCTRVCRTEVEGEFFFNDTATTEIYTLSLHDALPISEEHGGAGQPYEVYLQVLEELSRAWLAVGLGVSVQDRKSTRLNSSHANISYAVFCLKKNPGTTSLGRSSMVTSRQH